MLGKGRASKRLVAFASVLAVVALGIGVATSGDSVSAANGLCKDGTPPPCKPSGGEGEAASNNLSFPVIFPDGKPATWGEVDTWTFAPVTTLDACATEDGVPAGTALPTNILCYFARQNLGIDEATGARVWVGDPTLWWLQERTQNKWQVYDPVLPTGVGPLAVTAVDIGDLLESSQTIKNKQVRTEFNLLQTVDGTLATALGAKLFSEATIADFGWANQPVFAAMRMSGAVPGTDQSIDEIQGTDYGPGAGSFPGTGKLIDPRSVKPGFDANVYTQGARLVIQKVTAPGSLTWDAAANEWIGPAGTVSAPVVDIGTADGNYAPEINAGGSVVYGYNWSTQTASALGSGTYRLTFVLDSGVGVLNTEFNGTTLVNAGTSHPGTVVQKAQANGDAGLAYVDVNVQLGSGGGGKRGK